MASGPWTDLTNASLGQPTAYLGGTKGSHIVMDNPELLQACHGREIFFENSDGRIVLMYPLLGRVLVGHHRYSGADDGESGVHGRRDRLLF